MTACRSDMNSPLSSCSSASDQKSVESYAFGSSSRCAQRSEASPFLRRSCATLLAHFDLKGSICPQLLQRILTNKLVEAHCVNFLLEFLEF